MKQIQDIRHLLPRKYLKPRKQEDCDRIVIHHDAAKAPNVVDEIDRLKSYNKFHASKGWGGISYHFAVGKTGNKYKCVAISNKTAHAHAAGNTTGIAIMLMGDFTKSQPTAAQEQSVIELIAILRRTLPNVKLIFRHRDLPGNKTACPGVNKETVDAWWKASEKVKF